MRLRPLPVSLRCSRLPTSSHCRSRFWKVLTRQVGLQVLQQAGVVFVGGAAGDTIAEFFADDIAAGVHSLNGMVSAGGLAIELFGAGDFDAGSRGCCSGFGCRCRGTLRCFVRHQIPGRCGHIGRR